jgi:type IV pilus assembly protein PilB
MAQEPVNTTLNTDPQQEALDSMFQDAFSAKATDIHVHAIPGGYSVRFRVDGVIHEQLALNQEDGRRILNQIKVVARLPIERSFVPQEGQIEWMSGQVKQNMRVTILPGRERDSVHMRILSSSIQYQTGKELGLTEKDIEKFRQTWTSPQGLTLIAGRTGSGKTTSMYLAASAMDLKAHIGYSIEDPIEFRLPYLQQLEVNLRQGFTMFQGLRTLLRADPDILLVGEIRDQESAVVTTQAALAGRVALATIHARDVAAALWALHYLSVPFYVIGGSTTVAMAQGLVRRLCRRCAKALPIRNEERDVFDKAGVEAPDELMHPAGCDACKGYGYAGRIGCFEVVAIDDTFGDFIATGPDQHALRQEIRNRDNNSMTVDALLKVAQGVTSLEEVYTLGTLTSEH